MLHACKLIKRRRRNGAYLLVVVRVVQERIRRMDENYKRVDPQLMKKQRVGFLRDIFPHLTTKQIEGIID